MTDDLAALRTAEQIRADLKRAGRLVTSLTGSVDRARMRLLNDVPALLDAVEELRGKIAEFDNDWRYNFWGYEKQLQERDAALARMRALHQRNVHFPHYCVHCRRPYPCATLKAAVLPTRMHGDHPFMPGIDSDMVREGRSPDPRWCNTCGEAVEALAGEENKRLRDAVEELREERTVALAQLSEAWEQLGEMQAEVARHDHTVQAQIFRDVVAERDAEREQLGEMQASLREAAASQRESYARAEAAEAELARQQDAAATLYGAFSDAAESRDHAVAQVLIQNGETDRAATAAGVARAVLTRVRHAVNETGEDEPAGGLKTRILNILHESET